MKPKKPREQTASVLSIIAPLLHEPVRRASFLACAGLGSRFRVERCRGFPWEFGELFDPKAGVVQET
ncbi:hypothetical protein H6P81_013781 [Aristolochia fimbriata]|uniref:Uncharacterized protein n=1 Tax=Aristolochia fimbriata TaxID=158543 RepID=A0AAV7EFN0_ARIFI|nr:hypothetical protein H6P81_013781 [Aristolochia fimbriata]